MRIRDYQSGDAGAIVELFYETVHRVNGADYSPAQLKAWAPTVPDPEEWHRRIPDYEITPGETPRYSPGIREVQYLPLVWKVRA